MGARRGRSFSSPSCRVPHGQVQTPGELSFFHFFLFPQPKSDLRQVTLECSSVASRVLLELQRPKDGKNENKLKKKKETKTSISQIKSEIDLRPQKKIKTSSCK